jgi:protein tyrosine/serine phosphatase
MTRWLICLLGLLIVGPGCSPTVYTHGVPNLVQVEPGLWRSGQPTTPEAWAYLRRLGISNVIKLNFESEGSDDGAGAAGIAVFRAPLQPEGDQDVFDNISNTFKKPDKGHIDYALIHLGQFRDPNGGVLVHCTHGQDRTGLIIGLYRLNEGWTKDAAYKEMLVHHFHSSLHGLHEYWENTP